MNDNLSPSMVFNEDVAAMKAAQDEQLAKTKALAGKAITNPEALTADEVQEIGWGYLVALKRLRRQGATAM